jgi:hypothetical protein
MTTIRGGALEGPGIKFMTLDGTINKTESDLVDDTRDCAHLIYFCECDTAAGLITFTADQLRPITFAGSLMASTMDHVRNEGLNEKMLTIIYTKAGYNLQVDIGEDQLASYAKTTLDAVGEFWSGYFIVRPDHYETVGAKTWRASPTVAA